MASSFSGLFCIYEIGLLTLSKFILLDPILMFYMMASFHGLCMFNRENITSPWSRKWWIALLYTGISLGCTISTKIFQHFMARAFCLIFVPVLIYVAIFFVHDQVLIYSHHSELFQDGLGLSSFSSEFQKRLINSSLYNIKQPAEMSYGSVVTLKNDGLGGGYLHSHNFTYPEKYVKGNLQQVTTLKGKDINNYFRVLFPMDDPDMVDGFYFGEPEAVMHNNWIRLHHNLSLPTYYTEETDDDITKKFSEQFWNVKIKDGGENEPVKTLQTKFQLISPKFHCALTWSKESLSHVCFLERLAESHQVMTFINARLKPVDNFDNLDRPWMWPILYKVDIYSIFNTLSSVFHNAKNSLFSSLFSSSSVCLYVNSNFVFKIFGVFLEESFQMGRKFFVLRGCILLATVLFTLSFLLVLLRSLWASNHRSIRTSQLYLQTDKI
ncbi:Protein O-mannosyl-transferase 2 [Armadillidium vulgare]|nr:Protein O-mannosyl-transferase 2 [Armadillidium vulgare]